ncbi:MAG TPA: FHA domain-containing protein [Mycobacteriales bacterium]|nr:FHA domain-containing protein [Mycobacteriales bacterium]
MLDLVAGSLAAADGRSAELRDGLLVGRAPHADLRLDDPSVSREHVVIHRGTSTWTVTDKGSRNGTVLNGTRLPMYVDCPLRHGDRLEVGAVSLTVRISSGDEAAAADETRAMSLAGVRSTTAVEALSPYQLQVVQELARPWVHGGEPATNAEIAAALGTPLAVDAVKAALRRAYVKTGLAELPTHTKRRELCRVAQDRRWL